MPSGNERLVLEFEARTLGEAAVERLSTSLNKVVDIADRGGTSGANAAKRMGDAFEHTVPQMAAASGAIREFEGTIPIRAVERFISTTLGLAPVLSAAFPIVGGIAFAGMLVETGKRVFEFIAKLDPLTQANQRAQETTKALAGEFERLNREIATLQNKNLEFTFGKIPALNIQSAADQVSETALRGRERIIRDQIAHFEAVDRGAQFGPDGKMIFEGYGIAGKRQTVDLPNIGVDKDGKPNTGTVRYDPSVADERALQRDIATLYHQLSVVELAEQAAQLKSEDANKDAMREQQRLDDEEKRRRAEEAKRVTDKASEVQRRFDEYGKSVTDRAAGEQGWTSLALQRRDEMLAQATTPKQRAAALGYGALDLQTASLKVGEEEDRENRRAAALGLALTEWLEKHGGGGITDIIKENDSAVRALNSDIVKRIAETRGTIRESVFEGNSNRDDAATQKIRSLSIGARPEDELRIALEARNIRKSALDADAADLEAKRDAFNTDSEKLELSRKLNEIAQKGYDADYAYYDKVSEYVSRQDQQFRALAGNFLESAFDGSKGIQSFFKSQGERLVVSIGENATSLIEPTIKKLIPHAADPRSTWGKLLSGTPFGADPLQVATAANTAATIANTTALASFRPPANPVGVSGADASVLSNFHVDLPPAVSSFLASDPFAGLPVSQGEARYLDAIEDPFFGLPAERGSSDYNRIVGLPSGVTPPLSLSAKLAAGAEIGGGAIAAYQGFSQGGARGALEGTAGILGSASGVLSLVKGVASSVPIIGTAIAAALPIISSFLGDPKQQRENQIQHELTDAIYHAPTAISMSMSTNGTYMDRDAFGNLRGSDFSARPITENPYTYWGPSNTPYQAPGSVVSPYTPAPPPAAPAQPQEIHYHTHNYTIQAMDAQSFYDFAMENHQAFGDSAAKNAGQAYGALAEKLQFLTNRR